MSLHRFIISPPLRPGRMNITDPAILHQLTRVLRLEPGAQVIVSDGTGQEARATIIRHDPKGLLVAIEAPRPNQAELARAVTLCCALLKRHNFELVAQKATELGIIKIVPLLTERTIKQGLRHERVLAIIREAAEQSGRGQLPELTAPQSIDTALGSAATTTKLWWQPQGTPWQASLLPAANAAVSLWIGPEGGWTEAETAYARKSGATIVSFGPRILRAETAAIAAAVVATL